MNDREAWAATQRDALLGAGFKPHTLDGAMEDDGLTLWAWVYDELHGNIADVPHEVQNTVIGIDEETMTLDIFFMDPTDLWAPRSVEDLPWWKDWAQA